MARLKYIEEYMSTGGDNAKKLVACIEDYAKHSINDSLGKGKELFTVDTKYESRLEKAKEINEVFLSEVARRSNVSLAQVDGDVQTYAGIDIVAKMQAFVTSIMVDAVYPIYANLTGMAMLTEFHNVPYGGVVDFEVKDPTLYKVSKMDRRQKHTKVHEK